VAGRWFSPGSPVSSTNKTDHRDITGILLKTKILTLTLHASYYSYGVLVLLSANTLSTITVFIVIHVYNNNKIYKDMESTELRIKKSKTGWFCLGLYGV
jgi:hypothetical protein